MYNILFGTLPWDHWTESIKKLPHNIHIIDFIDIDTVIQYIINNKIDIIIALIKQQNFFVNDNYDILHQNVKYIFYNKNKQTIDLLNDKHKFNTFLKNNNFSNYLPVTYISCINNKQLMHTKYDFPCIYKLCISSGGASSYVIETKSQLFKELLDKTKNYVIQEYISGSYEYSAHMYVLDGIIKFSKFYCTHNDKKNYIQKGRMITYDSVFTPSYINVIQDIFTKLNYTGFACVDYKLKNNNPKIFEINPRPGATIVSNVEDFNDMIYACIDVNN
jgi:glutathione synthase/RimK-type ligase-like ATP-grasp enzyme